MLSLITEACVKISKASFNRKIKSLINSIILLKLMIKYMKINDFHENATPKVVGNV